MPIYGEKHLFRNLENLAKSKKMKKVQAKSRPVPGMATDKSISSIF